MQHGDNFTCFVCLKPETPQINICYTCQRKSKLYDAANYKLFYNYIRDKSSSYKSATNQCNCTICGSVNAILCVEIHLCRHCWNSNEI